MSTVASTYTKTTFRTNVGAGGADSSCGEVVAVDAGVAVGAVVAGGALAAGLSHPPHGAGAAGARNGAEAAVRTHAREAGAAGAVARRVIARVAHVAAAARIPLRAHAARRVGPPQRAGGTVRQRSARGAVRGTRLADCRRSACGVEVTVEARRAVGAEDVPHRTRVTDCVVAAGQTVRVYGRAARSAVSVGVSEEACIALRAVGGRVALGTCVAGGSSIAEGTSGARSRGVAGQALW